MVIISVPSRSYMNTHVSFQTNTTVMTSESLEAEILIDSVPFEITSLLFLYPPILD